ncbi:MAG: serine/threonine-protein kinase [Kofleriaceae bacterium]
MNQEQPTPERYCPTCERSFAAAKRCPDDGTELVVLASAVDPLLGKNLNGRYTIEDRLGQGGMGAVYRGTQHSVGRDVAIKVVSPRLVTDPEAIKRFLREAKLASRLGHPNAVAVLDFGQTPDGLFFLVMELLAGRTLDKVLRAEGRLPLPRLIRIATQICDALEGAHRLDIVHRDLKPANVMLLERDLVKVLDFGLAKSLSTDSSTTSMTGSGALLGTPGFMSPEAAVGRDVDARADLYSLGCMLYVLASGRMPFHAEHSFELISMQANVVPPPPPGVPAAFADVVMRLLEKKPDLRYQTATETRHALEASLVTSRANTPMALASTVPEGVIAMPSNIMASTIVSEMPPATAPAPAAETPTMAPPSEPTPPRRGAHLAIAGGVIAVIAVAIVVLRRPDAPPARAVDEQPAVVAHDAAVVAVDAAVAVTDDASVVPVVADAGVIEVDAAVVEAVRPTRPKRPAVTPVTPVVDAAVASPVDAAVASPPPDAPKKGKAPF